MTTLYTDPITADLGTGPFTNGQQVVLEQRHQGLPVLDGNAYVMINAQEKVVFGNVVAYAVQTEGTPASLLSALQACTIAATHRLVAHPEVPCRIFDMRAYYGQPADLGGGQLLIRPVWAIQFGGVEAVYYVDGISGSILEIDLPEATIP